MKKKSIICILALISLFCLSSVSFAGEVSQGKCTAYDKEKKTVTIDEYNLNFSKANPYGEATGVINSFDISNAQMGAPPEVGDILRLAYKVEGDKKNVVKLMNVTKQDMKKK